MSRCQQTFKQSDLTKAIKATIKAGVAPARVEIDRNGKIVIVPEKARDVDQPSPFEEWKRGHAR